ncbi:hypothetical protein Tsubulata_044073 [Turnera subulata]|uniref:Uncharacterized protein n=1 Tax=Turnera subulata TaxID=218843 RepID=A0A9Q0FE46_9ROSI|nr:hypothetical protein Tsubulata_044073 [Turnera subulata]
MATSAFKSTSKRTPIGKSSTASSSSTDDSSPSANRTGSVHRRSRSLSRFSRPLPSASVHCFDEAPAPKGRFVNTTRGSGFPEITLDDLAVGFFSSADRGRSSSRSADVSGSVDGKGSASQRRGRSVVRHSARGAAAGDEKGSGGNSFGGGRVNSETSNSRRRRSVSVVRYQISDSESDLDHPRNATNRATAKGFTGGSSNDLLSNKTSTSNHRPGLRRSFSQKDLKHQDGYSSNSSALTDDEGRDACSARNGIERTIRAVYSQKKAEHPTGENLNTELYEVMRKELRHAVEEIKMELGHTVGKTKTPAPESDDRLHHRNSEVLRAVSAVKRNYANKLEESEKRKQDLLAEIVLEEQRGKELSKIVKEMLPDSKSAAVEKPVRTRKRSNDRTRMSRRLTEEAEKYFEDFISNVEDTDISSLDGERSDSSSALGGIIRSETFQSPLISKSIPVEMEGVVLPWLQWETCNDASPMSCKNKEPTSTLKHNLMGPEQESTPAHTSSIHSISSRGSWSPGDGHSANMGEVRGSRYGELGSQLSRLSFEGTRKSQFDVDEYLKRGSDEDLLLEKWRQQQRIHSGSLLLCPQTFF